MGTSRGESIASQAQALVEQQLASAASSLIVILGPTASGKTALALDLAKMFPIEIVSADSRLVYRDMNIGTAKPTMEEQQSVPHHLIDIVSPEERFTLADYQSQAFSVIDTIRARSKLPIMVGGTMLYIDSVVYNYHLPAESGQQKENFRGLSLEQLQAKLAALNPDAERYLEWKNPVRLSRALEYYAMTGAWLWEQKKRGKKKYPFLMIGLQVDKDLLKKRITQRVDKQIAEGLIDEVAIITQKYPRSTTALTGIGYRQVVGFLQGKYSEAEMRHQIIHDTCDYAKRQMTWWRRNSEITWLEVVQ